MKALLERIAADETLVADGAMGTMLFERGLQQGQCPEAINLSQPEILKEIAGAYLDAGADIICSNTFGASPLKLAPYELSEETARINEIGVSAVRDAVGDRALVCASCGPCGKLLQPYGDADPQNVYDSFHEQIRALVGAGIDGLCVETMTDLNEAKLAIRAAKEIAPDIPVLATMTFDATSRGFFTMMGVSVEHAAAGLKEAGADVIGSNCGNGIDNMVLIAAEFFGCTDLPLIIQSNAGMPEALGDTIIYPETPEFMAEHTRRLIDIGVGIIGGCCGTTPDHIRAIRKAVDRAGA